MVRGGRSEVRKRRKEWENLERKKNEKDIKREPRASEEL
jgi:hypothetical protein